MEVTGFTTGDIQVEGAEKTSSLTESNGTYTLMIETDEIEGNVTVTVRAGAVQSNGDSNDETTFTFAVDNKVPELERATAEYADHRPAVP